MDPNGNIYASENPPVEDVARLDGYLRGLEAHDDDTAEQMRAMRRALHVSQENAQADRIRADLHEQLHREAHTCPECGATRGHAAECPIGLGLR